MQHTIGDNGQVVAGVQGALDRFEQKIIEALQESEAIVL